MRRTLLLAVMIAWTGLSAAAPVQGPSAITIQVHVDVDTSPLPRLGSGDLRVEIDGSPRRVTRIAVADTPASIVLLLDVSESTRWLWGGKAFNGEGLVPDWPYAHAVTHPLLPFELPALFEGQFIKRLSPGDRLLAARIEGFTGLSPQFEVDRDRQVALLRRRPASTAASVGSPIWDAVSAAQNALANESGRRAIVLFTDGESTANRRSFAELSDDVVAGLSPVHVVSIATDLLLPQADGATFTSRPSRRLQALAALSGGAYLQPPGSGTPLRLRMPFEGGELRTDKRPNWSGDPRAAIADVLGEIRNTVAVTIDISDLSPGTYDVAVTSNSPGVRLRAPTRLRVPGPASR